MLATKCYSRDVLEHYLLGRTNAELSGAIELHLESCAQCEDTVSQLDGANDTLVRTLQVRTGDPTGGVPDWVERIAGQLPQTQQAQETGNAGRDQVTTLPNELGDYELLHVLGRGGMSVVFAARHKHLGRQVALKVLLPTARQHAVSRERFTREMRAVGGLNHDSIIRATDAGEFQQTLYLVMDQIDGFDLKHLSRCRGPLAIADACAIGIQVARGLHHAHEQGVVHRDIKPSNLMLDRDGRVKILDFGLARMQSSGCDVTLQTTIGQLIGTLDYMSPEQASGRDVDARADIYAFGATMFKLLVGIPPHGRSQEIPIIQFLHRLANEPVQRVDQHREGIPSDLAEMIDCMLHRDPEQRIASADEVAHRLAPFAEGADLKSLVASVPDQAAGNGESLDVAKSSLGLAALPIAGTDPSDGSVDKRQPAASGAKPPVGWIGLTALAAASASLFGLLWLAISVTLKSPEGEFRIESDVLDKIIVEVVDEKDRVDAITVSQGTAVTTLRAGRYRVRLDSPSDEIEVTPNHVVISNEKIAIVKVSRVANPNSASKSDADPVRDPNVAMQARIELEESVAKLNDARAQQEPDQETIKALEERIVQLRALSQPIPTEPVYQGRTLADWTAQMRFEQQSDARKVAAESVLELAKNRPDEEKMALSFEANARLAEWSGRSIGYRLSRSLAIGSSSQLASTRTYNGIHRDVASRHIADALQSTDPIMQHYALVVCTNLRLAIQRGEWPELLSGLQSLSRSATPIQAAAQLTLAVCDPDASRAAKELVAIDLSNVSADFLEAMLTATRDSRIQVARECLIDWTARYIIHDQSQGIDAFAKYGRPGPLSEYDWNRINETQQAEINMIGDKLLDALEDTLAKVAKLDSPTELAAAAIQLTAARLSGKLQELINVTDLSGETRRRAIALLTQRIDQLLLFRNQNTGDLDGYQGDPMDTPAGAAGAIALLGGEVPESLKQPPGVETGYFYLQLSSARTLIQQQSSRSNQLRYETSQWFPYQVLSLLCDEAQNVSPGRNDLFYRWLQSSADWNLNEALVFDFGRSSPEAAELAEHLIEPDDRNGSDLPISLIRHHQWAKQVRDFLAGATDRSQIELVLKLIETSESDEEKTARYRGWLDQSDPARSRLAIAHFAVRRRGVMGTDFPADLQVPVARAIDRIAKAGPLESNDLYYLLPVAEHSANAPQYAVDYLKRELGPAKLRDQSFDGGIYASVRILMAHPEQVKLIEPLLKRAVAVAKQSGTDSRNVNISSINRLLDASSQATATSSSPKP